MKILIFLGILLMWVSANTYAAKGHISCADFSMKIEVHDIEPLNINAGTFQAKTELGYRILFSLHNCTLIFNEGK